VGDHQHRAGIVLEVVFQPFDRFRVKVVGRFVQQQDVGLLDQQAGQRDAALFTARQAVHRPVARRATQCLHGDFELVVERPAVDRVDLVLKLGHFRAKRVEIGVFFAISMPIWLNRSTMSAVARAPSLTFSSTVLLVSSWGSCSR
jgi:hypothetical protein